MKYDYDFLTIDKIINDIGYTGEGDKNSKRKRFIFDG